VTIRPVTRGGEPPRKKFGSPGKMCWTSFKIIGHSFKKMGPSENSSPFLMSQAGYGPGDHCCHSPWFVNKSVLTAGVEIVESNAS